MVDTGAVDAARSDLDSLADALFAHDEALLLDDVLKAAMSLDGIEGSLRLGDTKITD